MVTQISQWPEIYQIHVTLPQNPLKSLNCYVLRGADQNLLIDTGFNRPECREALWEGIRELRLDLGRTSVFLTHLHSDHIGLANELSACGCRIYMSEIDYDYFRAMKSGEVWPYMEALYVREGFPAEEVPLQAIENQGRRYAPERVFPAVTLRDGAKLRLNGLELQCIHTPGHTPGHMALYVPEAQIMFTGDHILFDITPNISVWKGVEHSLADYLSSLRKIKSWPMRAALPAHRGAAGDVCGRIDQLLWHHEARWMEILRVVAAEPGLNAHDIAGRVAWSARGRSWKHFEPHQKWFAMGETLAHLYHLEHLGLLERKGTGVIRYVVTQLQMSKVI